MQTVYMFDDENDVVDEEKTGVYSFIELIAYEDSDDPTEVLCVTANVITDRFIRDDRII